MSDLNQTIRRVCVSTDENGIIKSYNELLHENDNICDNHILVETDLNIDEIYIVDNYKLKHGRLVQLTEEEKPTPEPTPQDKMDIIKQKLEQVDANVLETKGVATSTEETVLMTSDDALMIMEYQTVLDEKLNKIISHLGI